MTSRPPNTVLLVTAFSLAGLAGGPALACGWAGESANDSVLEGVTVGESDLADVDTNTAAGMARMARAYRLGEGVPQDEILARLWTKRAARAGHVAAMNNLGQMLEMGIGGPEDQADAARWYASAAEAGIPQAQHSLAMMLFEGRGTERDSAEAERLLRLSARAGHPAAAADLAFHIWDGDIAPQDPHEGCLWSLVAGLGGASGGAAACRSHDTGLSEDALAALAARAETILRTSDEKGQS